MLSEKNQTYRLLLEQGKALLEHETDIIANMANFSALIFNSLPDLNWRWILYYAQ
ncbi:protein YtsP [Alishewanella longhuensis]